MYKCTGCGKEVQIDLSTARKIQCPFCGYRILKKERAPITRRIISE